MKKLLFIALFSIGFFAVSQAQINYTIDNQSADKWDFGMNHGNLPGPVYEYGIIGGTTVTGTIATTMSFPFNMAANDGASCFGTASASVPGTGSLTFPSSCTTGSVTYTIGYSIPLGVYILDVVIK